VVAASKQSVHRRWLGQPVTVYNDPDQPRNAVLDPESRQGSMAPLIFAAISAVVGAVILAFFIKVGFGS
jgi:hypothetical protein